MFMNLLSFSCFISLLIFVSEDPVAFEISLLDEEAETGQGVHQRLLLVIAPA